MAANKNEVVKVTIHISGKTVVTYETDPKGSKNVKDITNEIVSIVGERQIREERR